MKQQTIRQARAYTTRRNDLDNAIWSNEEAAKLHDINGEAAEASKCRLRAEALRAKHKRGEAKPVDAGLINQLGPRTAIANMLKDRFLEDRHGMTALMLRNYENPAPKSPMLVFIEGGNGSGMEGMADIRIRLHKAKQAAERTLPSKAYKKPLSELVRGHITLKQAGRQINGNEKTGQDRVKKALRVYLEAAEPFVKGA